MDPKEIARILKVISMGLMTVSAILDPEQLEQKSTRTTVKRK